MQTIREHSDQPLVYEGFLFAGWQVQPLSGLLEKNGQQVHLEPRVMDVLVCLATHQGEVVTREYLLEAVWGRAVVTEDALNRCISELRSVLGDTGRVRKIIRTVPRRGYILLEPVSSLPFAEAVVSQPSLADGFTARILVIASLFLVLTVTLGWWKGQTAEPSSATPVDVRAHDFYVLGRHHWQQRTPASLAQAEAYFRRAITLDPGYALAHAGLADALLFQTMYADRSLQESEQEIRDILEHALALDPQLAEAHASLGILMEDTGNKQQAFAAYREAIRIKPEYSMARMWLGSALMKSHDVRSAHNLFANALEVDPLHPMVQFNYLHSLQRQGSYEKLLHAVDQFYSVNPSEKLLVARMAVHLETGNYEPVLAMAVEHAFSRENRPYASEYVVNSLIELQRFQDARRFLEENRHTDRTIQYLSSRIRLAMAEKDAASLRHIAGELNLSELVLESPVSDVCNEQYRTYLTGLADYVSGEFAAADEKFSRLRLADIEAHCILGEPRQQLTLALYDVSNRLNMDSSDPVARDLLTRAEVQLDHFKSLGWNDSALLSLEIVMSHLAGDEARLQAVVDELNHREWQVLGQMMTMPLFDDVLASPDFVEHRQQLLQNYFLRQAQSNSIELANLTL